MELREKGVVVIPRRRDCTREVPFRRLREERDGQAIRGDQRRRGPSGAEKHPPVGRPAVRGAKLCPSPLFRVHAGPHHARRRPRRARRCVREAQVYPRVGRRSGFCVATTPTPTADRPRPENLCQAKQRRGLRRAPQAEPARHGFRSFRGELVPDEFRGVGARLRPDVFVPVVALLRGTPPRGNVA